jgi:3-oxoacyl-[acyl-carrier-protein] synthase-3
MKFKNVCIESYAYELPDTIISSDHIEDELSVIYDRLKLSKGRLQLMTGINERRVWAPGTKPSDLSTLAAKSAFNKSSVKPSEIDLLIHASVCRDFLEPATATVVHHNLELKKECMVFDLSNACLGVINAISIALIVSGENSGPLYYSTINALKNNDEINRKDIKKYIANLTIGSAATAIILSSTDHVHKYEAEIMGGVFNSDTSANHLCRGSGNTSELFMQTDSEELLHYGVNLGRDTFIKFNNLNVLKKIDLVLTHQVGIAHEKISLESLELEKHKTYKTYPTLGNTGSSALPITMMMAHENEIIKKDDEILMLGIGSGLVSIFLGVKWNS